MEMVLLLLLLLLLAAAAFVVLRRRAPRRDAFLLAGLTGAGKTTLFVQLCYGRVRKTVASLEMSEGPVPGLREAGAGVSVVDMPGHVRLRHDMLAKCGPRALGVVFVVDSAAMKKSPGDVAEYLYELLSAPALRGVPFLMLCNKQDLTWLALKPALVVSKLEGEFDTIRDSRRAALADVSTVKGSRSAADAAHPVILGVDGERFQFTQLPVSFETLPFSCISESSQPVNTDVILQFFKLTLGKA